jgi:hypothetical protein
MTAPTPSPRRALIVEDEILFAISLEADMRELGFDTRQMDNKPRGSPCATSPMLF